MVFRAGTRTVQRRAWLSASTVMRRWMAAGVGGQQPTYCKDAQKGLTATSYVLVSASYLQTSYIYLVHDVKEPKLALGFIGST